MDWREEYKRRLFSLEEMAKQIKSGDTIGTAMAVGNCSPDVYHAILDRWEEVKNVRFIDAVPIRPCKIHDPEIMVNMAGHIEYQSCFFSPLGRKMGQQGVSDFLTVMSSDTGDKYAAVSDVYITQVTPPNEQGFVNLGLTNFYSWQAIRDGRASGKQRLTIGEVNDQMPTIFGNNWLHVTEFDVFVENSNPIPAVGRTEPGELEKKVGEYVLELINDGDTIQMGIGAIPEAVISGLEGKHDLGVLTEMFPSGLPQLVEKGIVTNGRKPFHKGVTVATFCMGDQSMYDFTHENPLCEFYPACYTNNPGFIAQHHNMKSINMGLLIDFSGQIASEGMGERMISGTGGQLDFQIGAYHSPGGKGITLMTSSRTLKDGTLVSSIVPTLPVNTPITVPRTFADCVVTEYGIADLKYKTNRERAEALINIAHPDLRGELRDGMRKRFYLS